MFERTLTLNGFRIKEARAFLKQIQAIPESDYSDHVLHERKKIIDFHVAHNPYYREFTRGMDLSSWESVPVMTKKDLQRPLNERLSDGYGRKKVYVNKTSGSSGHPFVFAKDRWCHALTWAEIFDRFGWYGLDFHRSYQARFYGIPLDTIGYQKERLKDRLSSRYRFPIFNLSDKKLEGFLKVFRKKPFDYINGYTSSIVLFAKYLDKQGLMLKDICPTLKYCIVTSEMLYESDKQLMERCFGVPVINEYGASELDLIAFTNKEGNFQVNSDTLFVEIVDDKGCTVPHGQSGRIVITSLYNKAHPMIRYDIGDTGILAENSTFKKPILKELTGRTNDVAILPSGRTVPGLTFYYVTKSVIEDDGNVKEFVIVQNAPDQFHISYVSYRALEEQELQQIKNALYKYLEEGLELSFERVDVLDRSHRGKLKQFISRL